MKYVVTVADDFGFSVGENKGTLEAYTSGILKEMSLMIDAPGTEDAVRQCKELGIENVGIHITLNDLVGTGTYLRTPDYRELLENEDQRALENRVEYELKKFEDYFGRVPSHINSHHSVHQHPKLVDVISEYAGKHKLFVRRSTTFTDGKSMAVDESVNERYKKAGARLTDNIFEMIEGSYEECFNGFLTSLSKSDDDSVTEIFFHPGYVDETILKYTSLTYDRERDIKLLCDEDFRKKIKDMSFSIVSFNEIPR